MRNTYSFFWKIILCDIIKSNSRLKESCTGRLVELLNHLPILCTRIQKRLKKLIMHVWNQYLHIFVYLLGCSRAELLECSMASWCLVLTNTKTHTLRYWINKPHGLHENQRLCSIKYLPEGSESTVVLSSRHKQTTIYPAQLDNVKTN